MGNGRKLDASAIISTTSEEVIIIEEDEEEEDTPRSMQPLQPDQTLETVEVLNP